MPYQYVKAGPASKIASQVRYITLSPAVLDGINSFIDALLYAIIHEVATRQSLLQELQFLQPKIIIDDASPILPSPSNIQAEEMHHPITTESFKKASLSVCGRNSLLAREAILEAELLLNDWIQAKGNTSDPAISSPLHESHADKNGMARDRGGGEQLLAIPPFTRRSSNRSVSTLHSISDVGEDGAEEDNIEVYEQNVTKNVGIINTRQTVLVEEYVTELQSALELISPLGTHTIQSDMLSIRLREASKVLAHDSSFKYITPLLAIYASTFLNHIACEIIRGIADIVEMSPRMTEAPVEALNEYMKSDDRVRILWSKLQLPTSSSPPLRSHPKSIRTSFLHSTTDRPRSKSDIPHRFLSSSPSFLSASTTSVDKEHKKKVKRLSIDSELAQAHSEIIKLSRASPIEREEAAEYRRLSMVSINSGRDRMLQDARKMEGDKPEPCLRAFGGSDSERDPEVSLATGSATVVKQGRKNSLEDVTREDEEEEEEEKETLRATSSHSFASNGSLKRGFSMLGRRSLLRANMRAGKSDEGEKETAEERTRRGRDVGVMSSSIPFQASIGRTGSAGHGSNLSLSMGKGGGRMVLKKSGTDTEHDKSVCVEQQQPAASAKSTGRLSLNSSPAPRRRLSEEPDFEDLIMRGDTLRMTLTPSRFRQPSKDGSSNETPRRVHGSATTLGHTRKYSLPGRARGHSNGSTHSGTYQIPPSSSLSPLSAGIKLKARSAVAPKQPFEEDDTESSNTEREVDTEREDNVEELDLDSEDEAILGSPYKQKRHFLSETRKMAANKKNKETLFDILNSKPPWEDDHPSNNANGQASSKAQKLMGSRNGLTSASPSAAGALQTPHGLAPKKFAPIANLNVIQTLGSSSPSNGANSESRFLDERVSHAQGASSLLATPSIPDTTSLFTTTSMDGQSDFFSSKASFALTRKEFPLPPQHQQLNGATPSLDPMSYTSNRHSPNRLNSYKSSPDLGVATAKDSAMGAAGSSSLSIPPSTALGLASPVRRLQAKDERYVGKRVNDDLIDFLKSAGPPSDTPSGASSPADLPVLLPSGDNRTTSTLPNGTNGKSRLGSVNFRSLMGRASKRPSTAPNPVGSGDFSSGGGSPLQAVDELGRIPPVQQGAQTKTTHASLLNLGRRKSESKDPPASLLHVPLEGRKTGSIPPTAYLAHTALRRHMQSLSTTKPAITTTTMIMTEGHAASPISRQARNDWELAKNVEKQLELERVKNEVQEREDINLMELALIRESYATFADAQAQLTPKAFDRSMKEQRDTVPHPSTITYGIQQAPLLTPENSRDDLYRISNTLQHREKGMTVGTSQNMQVLVSTQAEAISGVDTPPATPEERVHSPQFTPLQSLPEDPETTASVSSPLSRASTSTPSSVISASPSTVMPGMAHKHQRRLSAVRRKPSSKVETGTSLQAITQTSLGDLTDQSNTSGRDKHGSRDVSSSSRLSGLDPAFISTPAAMLVDEYRGNSGNAVSGRSSEEAAKKNIQAGQASVHSLASTVNSALSSAPLSDLTHGPHPTRTALSYRSGSTATIATSRPPSTVLLPLSPRYVTAGVTGNKAYQAEIHDILLSLRNNLIAANSVSECLEIVDAALFEIAYETKECHPSSIIEEEINDTRLNLAVETRGQAEETHPVADEVIKDATRTTVPAVDATITGEQVRVVEVVKLRARTSRYVNRTFNAIIEYHLAYPSPPSIFPLNCHRLAAIKTYTEPLEESEAAIAPIEKIQIAHDKAPSLGYSVGDGTSTESEDTLLDKTSSDTTLVGEIGFEKVATEAKDSVHPGSLSVHESQEDGEKARQKAAEAIV